MPEAPIDGLASCEHPRTRRLAAACPPDPWRPAENLWLGLLAAALRRAGWSVELLDAGRRGAAAEARLAGGPPPPSARAPDLAVVELDHVLQLTHLPAWLRRLRAHAPGAIRLAAGRLAAAHPRACLDRFADLDGVLVPEAEGVAAALVTVRRRPGPPLPPRLALEPAPARDQLAGRPMPRPPALLLAGLGALLGRADPAARAPAAVAEEMRALHEAHGTERFVLVEPDWLAAWGAAACAALGRELARTAPNLRLAARTRLAEGPSAAAVPGLARLTLDVDLRADDPPAALAAALAACRRQAAVALQPVGALVDLATTPADLLARAGRIRAAGLQHVGQPGLLLNGLELLPVDAALGERALDLRQGAAGDAARGGELPWRDPRTARLWPVLRRHAVVLHERARNQLPALLLAAPDREQRRRLRAWRARAGDLFLDLVTAAAVTARDGGAAPPRLERALAAAAAAFDRRWLGRPFEDLLDRAAAAPPAALGPDDPWRPAPAAPTEPRRGR